jgi:hypothetical protein
MDSAKIIDITRSFIPINPNNYPETMHATGREDFPETRVPVVPYMGVNFLPTSYGYKSYFGLNDHLLVNSLLPNKCDYLFIFQTLTYKNVLVALCDTGIWMKDSSNGGEWTQKLAIVPGGLTTFFEWTFTVIKNKMYAFPSNGAAYYVLATDITTLGVAVTTIIPNFITPTAQLGLTRFGARLGFWDAENAIAVSSPDNLADFTPAVISGANVTTFNSILGKISSIRPHGPHTICYASKSITLLEVQPAETFLLKAVPILPSCGVPYARQSVESIPNTTHFAYTDIGIYKIENGKPELIIPEVFDYFKEYTQTPIYLSLVEGRYLFLETTDVNAINGSALFSRSVVDPVTVTFNVIPPTLDDVNATDPTVVTLDPCAIMAGIDGGIFGDQKAAAASAAAAMGPPVVMAPGSKAEPIWTCYISNSGVRDISNLTWTKAPCGWDGPRGTQFTMSPQDLPGLLARMTTNSGEKTAVTGAQAYKDGKWTMERFIQLQTAIWAAQQKAVKAFIEAILGRAFFETKVTPNSIGCVASTPPVDTCFIGRFVTDYSDPQFGYNKCSFWLTRYAIAAKDINAKHTATTSCAADTTNAIFLGYRLTQNGSEQPTMYGTAAEAVAAWNYYGGGPYHAESNPGPFTAVAGATGEWHCTNMAFVADATNAAQGTPGGGNFASGIWSAPVGPTYSSTTGAMPVVSASSTIKTETGGAHNEGIDIVIPPTPETAYCEITGWKVTKTDGTKTTVPAAACLDYNDKTPGTAPTPGGPRQVPKTPARTGNPINMGDGSMCGLPFDPPSDGLIPADVVWPDTSITYPGGNFLLQVGSIAPKYPTFQGAFVYDLALKKWGKMKQIYKQLLNYSPLNSASASTINFTTFGIVGGALKDDGLIYLFDNKPTESFMTWGKIGYYRLGMTDPGEVRIDFKHLATGFVRVDTSLDGSTLGAELTTTENFVSKKQVICYPEYSGKWHNVTVDGFYDIVLLEFKGQQKGRR